MLKQIERYFEFTHLGTNWRTEILAGVTTFLTMAYIVLAALFYPWGLKGVRGVEQLYFLMNAVFLGLFFWIPITALISWYLSKKIGK